MADRLEDFQKFRSDLNEEILGCGHLGMKRFFALDHQAYQPGPLGTKTKELLGLVASAVLRCDDCITYHLVRCGEEGWKRAEVIDALNVALIVGGSITVPHVRRAFARMRESFSQKPKCSISINTITYYLPLAASPVMLLLGRRRFASKKSIRNLPHEPRTEGIGAPRQ